MAHGWGPKRAVGGNENKNQWKLIDSSSDLEKGRQMMLDTDMCMFYQDNRDHAECMEEEHEGMTRNFNYCRQYERKTKDGGKPAWLNAKNAQCCAWMQNTALEKKLDRMINKKKLVTWGSGIIGGDSGEHFCGLDDDEYNAIKASGKKGGGRSWTLEDQRAAGVIDVQLDEESFNEKGTDHARDMSTAFAKELFREPCCMGEDADADDFFGDCDCFDWPKGPAMEYIMNMAASEEYFYQYYL